MQSKAPRGPWRHAQGPDRRPVASGRLVTWHAGARSRMRVGDVSLLAAQIVGESGSVLAVDRAVSSLENASWRAKQCGAANVAFVEADLATFEPGETFDAIVGRFVLLYSPNRRACCAVFCQIFVRKGSWPSTNTTYPDSGRRRIRRFSLNSSDGYSKGSGRAERSWTWARGFTPPFCARGFRARN